jgi:hypothetical protein
MTIPELRTFLFHNTNQYFIGDASFDINEENLSHIVEYVLTIYSTFSDVEVCYKMDVERVNQIKQIVDEFGEFRDVKNVVGIYAINYREYPDQNSIPQVPFVWKYDKKRKTLHCTVSGEYYLNVSCNLILDDMTLTDVNFLNLMIGYSLIYMGHARTDFGLSDLPFNIQDLRDEGRTLVDKTMDELNEIGGTNWYEAIEDLI